MRWFALGLLAGFAGCGAPEEKAPEGEKTQEHAPEKKHEKHESGHWAYDGATGPQFWGELDKKFETCGTGTHQTPIDLPEKVAPTGATPGTLAFDYQPIPVAILNNGHTVQVENTVPGGVVIEGARYYLVQMHMHSPSEHTIGGKNSAMELHLVHRNAAGELAVVGVMLNEGKENVPLKPIWDYLPLDVSDKSEVVPEGAVDIRALIPDNPSYYHYVGSLTTPPCSEGVRWFVLTQPSTVSKVQVERYQSLLGDHTNRPIQPLNDRKVSIFAPK